MAKYSLKLLFLRKYRTGRKIYRQFRSNTTETKNYSLLPTEEETHEKVHPFQECRTTGGERRKIIRKSTSTARNFSEDSVDCCFLIFDCVSNNKLRTFAFLLIVGLLSSTGLYLRSVHLLQYSIVNETVEQRVISGGDNDVEAFLGDSEIDDIHEIHELHQRLDTKPSHSLSNSNHLRPYLYRIFREDIFSPQHGIRLKRCTLPLLRPFSPSVKPFIGYTNRPNCVSEQRSPFEYGPPFHLKNGSLLERNPEQIATGCCYRPFHRIGEGEVGSSNFCADLNVDVTGVSSEHDYVEILCVNGETDFRDGFALIQRKDHVEDRVAGVEAYSQPTDSNNDPTRLSVIVLGLDATSRMNFIRAMPKANKFLLGTLSAISLNGYTKVAENTLPNLVPLLTGKTLEEFKDICVDGGVPQSVHLNKCPFIWKQFAENGYRTSFSEDDINIGIFNMNWANAFLAPPTDYYQRPFSMLMQKKSSFKNGYCYGSSLSFEKLLVTIKSMAEVFDKDPYFQFTWSTKLSHDDLNKMRWGDEPLYNFLHYLYTTGYLNTTALLVIGDHGSRLDRIRSTVQGKLEDRMPIAYFALPNWFKKKYTRAYQNLKRNADRVTSAFDVHKTFYDFMHLARLLHVQDKSEVISLPNNETVDLSSLRGTSLFHELPENRSCFTAGVPLHWCVCHKKLTLKPETEKGYEAAKFIVSHINAILHGEPCAKLHLESVDELLQWDPSEICSPTSTKKGNTTASQNRNSNISSSVNSSLTDSSDNSECSSGGSIEVIVLQVAFTTLPSDATFETTVMQLQDGSWRLTEDVVRTNSYEGQSDCVEQHLKPYCFCSNGEYDVEDSFFSRFF